jgi:hypothetical protein
MGRTQRQKDKAREHLADYYEKVAKGERMPPSDCKGKYSGQVGRFLNTALILDPEIRSRVRRYISWAREEMGDEITVGQLGLLATLRVCLTVMLLAEQDMAKAGTVTQADGDVRPLFKTLNAYLNSFRQTVTALDLLPRRGQGGKGGAQKPPGLEEVVASYRKRAEEAKEPKEG